MRYITTKPFQTQKPKRMRPVNNQREISIEIDMPSTPTNQPSNKALIAKTSAALAISLSSFGVSLSLLVSNLIHRNHSSMVQPFYISTLACLTALTGVLSIGSAVQLTSHVRRPVQPALDVHTLIHGINTAIEIARNRPSVRPHVPAPVTQVSVQTNDWMHNTILGQAENGTVVLIENPIENPTPTH